MSNSDNPKNGAIFQKIVKAWFEKNYNAAFDMEHKIAIGEPAKDHKFDIVCERLNIVIECKRYTWTKSWNVPSAKMGTCNEASFYLSFLPDKYKKYIVMMKSYNEKRKETLAEYYYRTYKHLIGDILVAEFDIDNNTLKIINSDINNE